MKSPKAYTWLPVTLGGLYPDGQLWVLYQTNHRKGYPHYIGRVCRHDTYDGQITCYTSEAGTYSTMAEAAKDLLNNDREL